MNNKSIKNIETAKNLLAQAKQLKKQDKIIAATNILLKAKKLDPNNLHIWEFLALYKRFAVPSAPAEGTAFPCPGPCGVRGNFL